MQKALYLKEVTQWFRAYNSDTLLIRREPFEKVRAEQLTLKKNSPKVRRFITIFMH